MKYDLFFFFFLLHPLVQLCTLNFLTVLSEAENQSALHFFILSVWKHLCSQIVSLSVRAEVCDCSYLVKKKQQKKRFHPIRGLAVKIPKQRSLMTFLHWIKTSVPWAQLPFMSVFYSCLFWRSSLCGWLGSWWLNTEGSFWDLAACQTVAVASLSEQWCN